MCDIYVKGSVMVGLVRWCVYRREGKNSSFHTNTDAQTYPELPEPGLGGLDGTGDAVKEGAVVVVERVPDGEEGGGPGDARGGEEGPVL